MFFPANGTPNEFREWTLMFFFASDNQLSPSIVSQLKAIKDAGFHHDVNVVVRFDPHTVETPTHIFDVNLITKLRMKKKHPHMKSDVGFNDKDPYVRNLVADKLWRDDEGKDPEDPNGESIRERLQKRFATEEITYDPPQPPKFNPKPDKDRPAPAENRLTDELGPEESLEDFLKFCREFYPARHYVLFILGHGVVVGNDLFLFDEHADGKHSVTLKKLGELLTNFTNDIGTDAAKAEEVCEFELVSFHSCSMSGLEVAYELKNSAKYMLASEGSAFVGSWPYKQILIRLFNDLDRSSFAFVDIKDTEAFAKRIVGAADPVSIELQKHLSQESAELLELVRIDKPLDPEALKPFLEKFNKVLDETDLHEKFAAVSLAKPTRDLVDRHQEKPLEKAELRILNRKLLAAAFPHEIDMVRGMLSRVFDYCLYNSYDFQLAGYSFDLCLTDLRKLNDKSESGLKAALERLAAALIKALPDRGMKDPPVELRLAQELILLAHWESQSYYEENYIDLFDFCFRLFLRCVEMNELILNRQSDNLRGTLDSLVKACADVTALFPVKSDYADGLIVRSGFAGPTYQYSHGLSVYFPWSEPVGSDMWKSQYPNYKLVQESKTSWKAFLEKYLGSTQRLTQAEEKIGVGIDAPVQNEDAELLEEMGRLVFNEFGQLKDDAHDKTEKDDKHDHTGDDCACPSIKNYPPFTRSKKVPASKGFDKMRLI